MAIDSTVVRFFDNAGVRRRRIGDYSGPSSYTNPGGDTITAAQLSLGRIEKFTIQSIVPDDNGANLRVIAVNYASDRSSVTVRWFTDLATEVANAVDLSAYNTMFEAVGY